VLCSTLGRVIFSGSSVGILVGEIVGVSDAARVGNGEVVVIEVWFIETFSAITTGEGLEMLFTAMFSGMLTRVWKRDHTRKLSTRIFIVSISARLKGDNRMLRREISLLLGAEFESSETSGLDVIRKV
jgi:hypothetical protein